MTLLTPFWNRQIRRRFGLVAWSLCLALLATSAMADEGMWLYNQPPRQILKQRYGFEPSDVWLDHLRLSSVRFNSGGSGSFVSSRGLVMTNHHVGADALQKLSTPDRDLIKDGFFARTPADELKCVDLELNVLQSIEDVTDRVQSAAAGLTDAAAAFKARRAVMNTIEKESWDKSGLRSDVITLYQGGLYHLYRYKKYTDVRLVFAPEQDIAFFGGDPDNFEYPRFDLDICFFRVYENDQPAKIEHFLRWSRAGATDGELVFVSGHPGRTDRLNTVAHLEFLRDRLFPYSLDRIRRQEVLLSTYSQRSLENARRAQDDLFGVQNTRKARLGGLAGLQDPAILDRKQAAEKSLRDFVAAEPGRVPGADKAWDEIGDAIKAWKEVMLRNDLLEHASAFHSHLFGIARGIVRLVEEGEKPNEARLREYRQSNLDSLKQQLFSTAPIYTDLEIAQLADSLSLFMEIAGADNALVKKVLANQSPRQRAAALVDGSKLADVAVRKKLVEGGRASVEVSDDPMVELARMVDAPARAVRRTYEEKIEEPQRQAYAKIAKARFAQLGTGIYPDATFTLRLSFGVVRGYREQGRDIPPWTTMAGLYQRAAEQKNRDPFQLPPRWIERKGRLNPNTPLNFICTPDIIGGNSGSPVVNRQGELVGIIFDGNLDSLVWDFVYDDKTGRSLAVHAAGIVEALDRVYDAGALVAELGR